MEVLLRVSVVAGVITLALCVAALVTAHFWTSAVMLVVGLALLTWPVMVFMDYVTTTSENQGETFARR